MTTTTTTTTVDPYEALEIMNPEQALEIVRREVRTADDRRAFDLALRIFAAYDPFVAEDAVGRPLDARELDLIVAEIEARGAAWLVPHFRAGRRP